VGERGTGLLLPKFLRSDFYQHRAQSLYQPIPHGPHDPSRASSLRSIVSIPTSVVVATCAQSWDDPDQIFIREESHQRVVSIDDIRSTIVSMSVAVMVYAFCRADSKIRG
jgi:hypothetical protein